MRLMDPRHHDSQRHGHSFGQERRRPGEARTIIVIAITAATMVVEIAAGIGRDADTRVTDLHVWSVGPGIYAVELVVLAGDPKPPEHYKRLLPPDAGLVHVNVEVQVLAPEESGD